MRVLAGCRFYVYALSFLAGAVIVQAMPALPSAWFYLLGPPLVALGRRYKWLMPLTVMFLGCAWTIFRADVVLSDSLARELERRDFQIQGQVVSLVQREDRYLKFLFSIDSLRYEANDYPSPGKASLRWYYPDSDIRIGECWRFTVRLKRPHGFQNDGGFDYERWLFRNSIRATGYVVKAEPILSCGPIVWWGHVRETVQLHLSDPILPTVVC